MKKIRLIALDLDGTLLDDRKDIPPANIEALREAQAAGIRIAIASGRMTPRIVAVEERLGIDTAIIAYNGGKIIGERLKGRPLLLHLPLPAAVADVFIRFSRQSGHLLNFYLEDTLYAEDGEVRRRFMEIYSGRTGAEYRIVDLSRFLGTAPTKLILLAEPPECDRLLERFRGELGPRASITKSDPEYLEIMAPGVDKGTALPALAEHFGISTEEILAIGDADNDTGMLRRAGVGVAMANATPGARQAAAAVTERSNNEGGVAEAIRRFALS
jgi:Cof subfamily protein (haloacid dehalogenase superfamily)